jgi:tripartite-type tricarboxylate transporter receptor subunit TctC
MFDVTPTALPQVRAGKLRALAVTMPERLDILPGVPAMAQFLPGYEAFGWSQKLTGFCLGGPTADARSLACSRVVCAH